jgi:hypothetical protein
MHKDFDLQVEHTRHKCAIYEWMGVVMITKNTFPSLSSSSSTPFSNPITQINTQTNTTHIHKKGRRRRRRRRKSLCSQGSEVNATSLIIK